MIPGKSDLRGESESAVASEFVSHLLTKTPSQSLQDGIHSKHMLLGLSLCSRWGMLCTHGKDMKKDVNFSAFGSSTWFLCGFERRQPPLLCPHV